MIKGDYFLKLLKPLFSILLIGFFGLLGNSFVNAGYTQLIGVENYPSIYDSNYSLSFLKGGGFLSSFLGQGKSVLALKNNDLVWWSPNGYLYAYLGYSYQGNGFYQGFFDRYYSCDEITDFSSDMPGNCTIGGYISFTGSYFDSNREVFKTFFSTVKQGDFFYYDYTDTYIIGGQWQGRVNRAIVCWSSSEIGKSICFNGGLCSSSYASECNPLINSQGLRDNLTFTSLDVSLIGKAPGQNGYGGVYDGITEGSNQGFLDTTYTGDYTYTECSNGSIMNYAEKMGISPYMCQGGLDNWDLLTATGIYNPIPGSGKWLDEIYGQTKQSGQGLKDWFNYRNTAYINQYVSNQNIWYSQPAVLRSYFKFYNEYGGSNFDFDTVYEYCLMRKFYTRDNQFATQKYNGQYFKKTCSFINNGGWDGTGGNPGEDIIGMNWNGIGGLSGSKTYSDPGVFITDMFTKIKSYIPTDKSDIGLGFLPAYIIAFMLFLILFRFLSH